MSSDETTADITHRLRRWTISTDAVPASDLMDEAAAEIDRLRLTDAEREALESMAAVCEIGLMVEKSPRMAATLRGLLERLK